MPTNYPCNRILKNMGSNAGFFGKIFNIKTIQSSKSRYSVSKQKDVEYKSTPTIL